MDKMCLRSANRTPSILVSEKKTPITKLKDDHILQGKVVSFINKNLNFEK